MCCCHSGSDVSLDDLTFETSCYYCAGKGTKIKRATKTTPKEIVACTSCDGKGKILTMVGERLLSFLRQRNIADIYGKPV